MSSSPSFVKVVLVTGGSSGIGQAICQRLSAQGHRVFGTTRKAGEQPNGYRLVDMDITDEASVRRGVDEVLREAGHIDVLVNNAGLGIQGPAEDITPELALHLLDTNVLGAHRVCQAVLPGMRYRKAGLVINISSLAANFGLPFRSFYSASKAALERYTESLSMEVAPFGIHVVSLQPGEYNTKIATSRLKPTVIGNAYEKAYARTMEVLGSSMHYSRDPDEVAVLVAEIMAAAKPKSVYRAAHGLQLFSILAKKLLPGRRFEKMVMKHYK